MEKELSNFLYTLYKVRRKSTFCHLFLVVFLLLVMQQIYLDSFFKQVCFEKKKCFVQVAGFLQLGLQYVTITHDHSKTEYRKH